MNEIKPEYSKGFCGFFNLHSKCENICHYHLNYKISLCKNKEFCNKCHYHYKQKVCNSHQRRNNRQENKEYLNYFPTNNKLNFENEITIDMLKQRKPELSKGYCGNKNLDHKCINICKFFWRSNSCPHKSNCNKCHFHKNDIFFNENDKIDDKYYYCISSYYLKYHHYYDKYNLDDTKYHHYNNKYNLDDIMNTLT